MRRWTSVGTRRAASARGGRGAAPLGGGGSGREREIKLELALDDRAANPESLVHVVAQVTLRREPRARRDRRILLELQPARRHVEPDRAVELIGAALGD